MAVYSSLRKIDFVAQAPDGRRHLVQTDHRSPAEIDEEPELSTLFALARILVPQRSEHADAGGNSGGDAHAAVVRYVALGGVHPVIARVVASTGAELEVDRDAIDLSDIATSAPADLADDAFAGLGRRVLERHGLTATEEGLATFEKRIDGVPTEEEDEIGYWTAVAELAAVTGEVIRQTIGGRWIDDAHAYADIPFLFRAGDEDLSVNAVGKAVKFFAHGETESPRHLLRALEDRGSPAGPLLVGLKPSSWGARDEMVCEPMVDLRHHMGADMPIIVYGNDHPNTFAMFKRGDSIRDLGTMRTEALANLASIEIEVEKVELETLTFWIGHGNYFAAEKVLDVAFMQRMHAQIGELLAVAVPEKGRLFIANAVADIQQVAGFLALARGVFDRNEGGRQLSPTVFLVSEGVIVGVAQPEGAVENGDVDPLSGKKKNKRLLN